MSLSSSKRKKKDEREEQKMQKIIIDESRFHISVAAASRWMEVGPLPVPNDENYRQKEQILRTEAGLEPSNSCFQEKLDKSKPHLMLNPMDSEEKKSVETLLAATKSNADSKLDSTMIGERSGSKNKDTLDSGAAAVAADNNEGRRKSARVGRYKGSYNVDVPESIMDATTPSTKKARVASKLPQTSSLVQSKKLQKAASSSTVDFSKISTSARNEPIDDDDGHLIIKINSILSPRYAIVGLLGQGTFGKVVEAWDQVLQKKCAIKIIKAIQKYSDAAQIEIKVLKKLKQNDPHSERGCIQLNDYFLYQGHICMVFDLLSQSLFDFFQEANFAPFSIRQIQSFAQQLINSIVFLHDLRYIHTDLKPENLMLVNKEKVDVPLHNSRRPRKMLKDTRIVLIDFGSTIAQDDYHSSVVSTRHYRAPEILLDLGWSFPCDIWSIGCILVELYTGVALFQTHDNLEHLRMMEIILGPFPRSLIKHLSEKNRFYFDNNRVKYPIPSTEKSSIQYLGTLQPLENIIRPRNEFEVLFLDFCRSLLSFHPDERITARQAQQHEFLNF